VVARGAVQVGVQFRDNRVQAFLLKRDLAIGEQAEPCRLRVGIITNGAKGCQRRVRIDGPYQKVKVSDGAF